MSAYEKIEIIKYKTSTGIKVDLLKRNEKGNILHKEECFDVEDLIRVLGEHLDDFRQQPYCPR